MLSINKEAYSRNVLNALGQLGKPNMATSEISNRARTSRAEQEEDRFCYLANVVNSEGGACGLESSW